MNWEAIGAIGEIGGAVILIVSILFLARQIREGNAHAQAASEQHVQDSWNNILREDRNDLEVLEKGFMDFGSLNDIEKSIFSINLSQKINHLEMVLRMEKKGLLDGDTVDVFKTLLTMYLNSPGGKQFWSASKDLYQPLSTQHINDNIGKGGTMPWLGGWAEDGS